MSRTTRHVRSLILGTLALTLGATLPVVALAPATAVPDNEPAPGLLAWWRLDETSGATVADSSGNDLDATVVGAQTWSAPGEGFTFSGGTNGSGNAIALPDDLTRDRDQISIDLDVWVDPSMQGNWFLFNLGNQASFPGGDGYLFVTGQDAQDRFRGTITESGYTSEQSASRTGGVAEGAWRQVTYTVDGGTPGEPGEARLYEEGRLVASTAITTSPALLGTPDGSTTRNILGRSAYPGDLSFQGRMRDVRLYERALSGAEVAEQTGITAAQAAETVSVPNAGDLRGDVTLPTTGGYGESISWASTSPGVVSPDGEVTRPPTGAAAASLVLTATLTLGGDTVTRTFPVTVRPLPATEAKEAYAFAYFTGEGADGENISLAASRGDDPLSYQELNQDASGTTQPILTSTLGEKGLRDPFLIRSAEGDRFFLLATDLRIAGRAGGNDFGSAQENGSRSLMIWESTDLVNWSDQREVKVSSDFAGNTWAPEAFFDEETEEYVVYWASALYPTPATNGRDIETSYQRMMFATTKDFATFSEPQPWIDVERGPGDGMIDATIARDGDTFYRIVKDEATFTVRQERSTDLRDTVSGTLPTTTSPAEGWQLIREQLGAGQTNPWGGTFRQGEGPTVFRDNELPDRWYLFIDQPSYHGGEGYLALQTDDIASADWTVVADARLPSSPRHGTVIPVSQAELDTMRAGYQPDLLVSSVDDVALSTAAGTAPVLPGTVPATFGDGRTGTVAVTWAEVPASAYAAPGTFTVQGTVVDGSADDPVATVTVPAAPPVVVPPPGASPGGPPVAGTTTVLRVRPARADGRGARARVRVTSTAALPATVTLTLRRGDTTVRTRVLVLSSAGTVQWAVPRVRSGRPWRVTAVVAATATQLGSGDRARVRLRR